jgi:hypothetical protein
MLATANGTVSARTREFEYNGLLNNGTSYLIWGSNEPRPPGASWFRLVERRISESSTQDPNLAGNGHWLPQATAIAALKFFEAASDLLPGEPYIYGSPLGDLVAEFDGEKGTLTSVIGPNVTLLYAIIGGIPIKRTVHPEGGERELRSELKELSESLCTGKYGTLETEHR